MQEQVTISVNLLKQIIKEAVREALEEKFMGYIELSPKEKKEIEEARKEIERGEYVEWEKVKKELIKS